MAARIILGIDVQQILYKIAFPLNGLKQQENLRQTAFSPRMRYEI
jgi:hypothetical protein